MAEITATSATGSLLPWDNDSDKETPTIAKLDLNTHCRIIIL